MKKSKLFGLITEVIYLLNLTAAIVFAIYLKLELSDVKMQDAEGNGSIGIAIGAAILALILILTLIYTVYSLLPLLFKSLQLMIPKKGFSVTCIVFDVISFLGASVAFVSIVVGEGTLGGLIIFLIPALLFAAAFVLNLLTYKAIDSEEANGISEEACLTEAKN